MLVISRKPGEQIRLGADISITVLEVRGKLVRIGLTAPAEIRITRPELDEPRLHAGSVVEGTLGPSDAELPGLCDGRR